MTPKTTSCGRIQVSEKVLDIWKQKKSRGDVNNLVEYTGLSKPVIIKALRHGFAKPDLILSISKYYSKKQHDSSTDLERKALEILKHQS